MKMAMRGDMNLDQGVACGRAVAAGSTEAAQAKDLPVRCPRRDLDLERAAIRQRQSTRRAVHGVEKARRQGVALVLTMTWAIIVRLSPLAEHGVEDVAELGVAPSADWEPVRLYRRPDPPSAWSRYELRGACSCPDASISPRSNFPRFLGSDRIELAADTALNVSSAFVFPGLRSGWCCLANFRYASRMASWLASRGTPRVVYGSANSRSVHPRAWRHVPDGYMRRSN